MVLSDDGYPVMIVFAAVVAALLAGALVVIFFTLFPSPGTTTNGIPANSLAVPATVIFLVGLGALVVIFILRGRS
jgi:hypothetical protein